MGGITGASIRFGTKLKSPYIAAKVTQIYRVDKAVIVCIYSSRGSRKAVVHRGVIRPPCITPKDIPVAQIHHIKSLAP